MGNELKTHPVTKSWYGPALLALTLAGISGCAGTLPNSSPMITPTITMQPSNQTVNAGQTATFTVAANGTAPLSYQWLQNTGSGFAAISGATSSNYTTPATSSTNNGTTFEVTISNSAGSITSSAATLSVTTSPTITTQPMNQTVNAGQSATFTVVANGTAPLSYQWMQNAGSGFTSISGATSSNYSVTATSANNGTIFEVTVSNAAGSVTSGMATLSLTGMVPILTTQPSNQSVAVGQSATFTVAANGTALLSYQWLQNTGSGFTNIPGATSPSYTTPLATLGNSGTTFEAKVSNSQGSVTSNVATLTVTATSPTITTQPTNQTVNAGQTATFTVAANGTALLSYQWLQNTGSGFAAISGATSSSYTTPATSSADNGTAFEVTVSNSAGSITSNAASLTVLFAPTIVTQPSDQSVVVGQSATFTVVANGTAPLSYQWLEDTGSGFANITGATSASYTTPTTTSLNTATTFEVTVTNEQGSATSNAATLTVTSSGPSLPSYGSGFTSSGLTLNGDGTINGTALQLTDGGASEASSGFFSTLVNVQSFTTTFTFQPTNANADGFTFTIQNNSPSAVGGGGGSLGYGPTSGTTGGILNSVAVGFQLYTVSSGEVSLLGMWTNGVSPGATPGTDMTGSGINLHSGDTFKVRMNYTGTTLSVDVRDVNQNDIHFIESFAINIPATVGSSTAYVGFTGGDGGLTSTQDILSWSFNNSPTGTSGTFTWPVDEPVFIGVNDYSTYNGQYHTGLDVCPGTAGCQVGNPIYATAGGTVQAVQVTTDPSQTMCDGSSTGSLPTENNNHLGNAVIIAHANGKFSVYGHLDCVWPGIAGGVVVSQGQRIGNMGHSQYGTRSNSFTPHVHFEIKDAGTVEDPTGQGYSGFTPDLPDGYGYHDPRVYIYPYSSSGLTPGAVKIVGSPLLNVLSGPDTSYSLLSTVSTGQEFVAFASSGSWYEIYLPNSQGAVAGWIPANAGSQALASPDSTATMIQVQNTGGAGLLIRPGPSSSTDFVNWVTNTGFMPFVQNCNPTAKIWDGQYYVTFANQSGWYEYYLPGNYYFSSASACQAPSGPGSSSGWSSASLLTVVP